MEVGFLWRDSDRERGRKEQEFLEKERIRVGKVMEGRV